MKYFFDAWSVGHFALWAVLGFAMMRELRSDGQGTKKTDLVLCLVYGLGIGLTWEMIEQGLVEPLFGFHEPWYNRGISDPLVDLWGTLVGALVALEVD